MKKKKITYTKKPIKSVEKADRIVANEAWHKKPGKQVRNLRKSWNLKRGDLVQVIKGKDKGKTGKIKKVLPKKAKVIVENLNLKKRHRKLPGQNEGTIEEKEFPIWIWNVMMVVEQKQGTETKLVRTRIRRNEEGRRVAVKTGEQID